MSESEGERTPLLALNSVSAVHLLSPTLGKCTEGRRTRRGPGWFHRGKESKETDSEFLTLRVE